MKEFKLIVAGSRDFTNNELLEKTLMEMAETTYKDVAISIVSGMARGADSLSYLFAIKHNVAKYQFPADWNKHGKAAGFIRNREMGDFADGLLAFWDGRSRGTAHMIEYMESLGKPVHVIRY